MSKGLRFRGLRLLGATVLATATVPFLGVAPASADDATMKPALGAYFYAEGIRKPDPAPAAPPNLTGDHLDGVAKGNLAVAAGLTREDKVSFLLFDLLDLEPGTVVTQATLTLPLVPLDPDNWSYNADPAKVVACVAGDQGFGGDDGVAIEDAPTRDCSKFAAVAKASADGKSYVFDITKLAQVWVDSNDGVALTAAEDARTEPFQVVFGPADKAQLALSFTPPASTEVSLPEVPLPPVTTDTTSSVGSSYTPSAPAPAVGTITAPVMPDLPAPAPGVAPQAAAPTAPVPAAALRPAALDTSLVPTAGFWLAGLLLAGLLVLLSLIMGDPSVPQAAARPTRLSQALAQRKGMARPSFGRAATV